MSGGRQAISLEDPVLTWDELAAALKAGHPFPGDEVVRSFRAGRITSDQLTEYIGQICNQVDTSLDEGVRALRDASLPKESW